MKKINTQFHASPMDMFELISLLRGSVVGVRIYEWTRNTQLMEISSNQMSADTERLIASIGPIEVKVWRFYELLDAYPGLLVVNVPKVFGGALREIAAMAQIEDGRGMKQFESWRYFIRSLRKSFKSGAFVSVPGMGVGRYYKTAHAMKGALALQKDKVVLLAAAGNAQYDYYAIAT